MKITIQAILLVAAAQAGDIEDVLEAGAEIQASFEANPEQFLDHVHEEIVSELNRAVGDVDHEMSRAQDDLETGWIHVTGQASDEHNATNLQSCESQPFTDAGGDSCDWYVGMTHACGNYDSSEFVASRDCCACGGGVSSEPSAPQEECYSWNDYMWKGVAPSNPAWTVCGGMTCTGCDSTYTQCYEFNGGPGVEVECVSQEAVDAVMDAFADGLADQLLDHATVDESQIVHGPLPMREIEELTSALNWIGTDPNGFLNEMREGILSELRRGVEDIDRGLDEIKREILRDVHGGSDDTDDARVIPDVRPPMPGSDECLYWFLGGQEYNYDTGVDWSHSESDLRGLVDSQCALWRAPGGGEDWDRYSRDVTDHVSRMEANRALNLEHSPEYAEVQEMLNNLGNHNLNLAAEVSSEPLAAPQWEINIDEQSAQDHARELEAEYDEWNREFEHIMSDWATDQELLERYYWNYELKPHLEEGQMLDTKTLATIVTFIADSTQVTGRPLVEVFPDIEEHMLSNFDPNGPSIADKFGLGASNFSQTRALVLEEEFHVEVMPEIESELHHAVDEVSRDAVTYSFYFDTERVNEWINKEVGNYDLIQRMYEAEIESYWNQIAQFTESHHENMRELDRMTETQVEDTAHDVLSYFEENFSAAHATTLSAKIAGQKKNSSNSEIMMYIVCALLSLVAIAMQARIALTKDKKVRTPIVQHDIYEKLV